jgi:hypothetical protein
LHDRAGARNPFFPVEVFAIFAALRTVIRPGVLIGVVTASLFALSARPAPAQTLPAPVLEPFDGRWHAPTFTLRGEVDHARFLSRVRVLRNDAVVDSVFTSLDSLFTVQVALEPGLNEFTAILVDSSLATSPPSNRVIVRFDTSAGFFIKIPMAPGSSFDLNAVGQASRAEVRIFDMAGDIVVEFESAQPLTFYSFIWNGRNGSGERVRRGPLIAVGILDYPDGTHDVVKRAFLFDPEGSP